MKKSIAILAFLAVLVFVVWWEGAAREIQVPEHVLKSIPECVQYQSLPKKNSYYREEFEELNRLATACSDAKIEYFREHGTEGYFLQPPFVLQKWLESRD